MRKIFFLPPSPGIYTLQCSSPWYIWNQDGWVHSWPIQGCHKVFKLPGKYKKQVGNQTARPPFLLVLFALYFSLKVAGEHVHSSQGKNPRPPPLNDSPGLFQLKCLTILAINRGLDYSPCWFEYYHSCWFGIPCRVLLCYLYHLHLHTWIQRKNTLVSTFIISLRTATPSPHKKSEGRAPSPFYPHSHTLWQKDAKGGI